MSSKLSGKIKISVFIIFIVLAFFTTNIMAQEDIPVEKSETEAPIPETKRDVKGIVVNMLSGEPVAGATVSLPDKTIVTGADGRFTFAQVNEYHAIQMTARITTDLDIIIGCSYFVVPTSYYPISANKDNMLDIQIINMLSDDEVVLKVGDYAVDTVDSFCLNCHEVSPCLIEEDYGRSSKKVGLKGVMVKQSELEKYIEKVRSERMTVDKYKKIRHLDSHPKNVDISLSNGYSEGRIFIPEDLLLKDDKILTCDTCHTRHVPTAFDQFVVLDYNEKESICLKCHK